MLLKIKNETKEFHNSVEKVLISHLKNLNTEEEYADLLIKLCGFFESVEHKIHYILKDEMISDLSQRVHVKHLKSDIYNLQRTFTTVENTFADTITTVSYALGVLYVMEGSTLGGQIISKMLFKQLPNLKENDVSYFKSYEDEMRKLRQTIEDKDNQLNLVGENSAKKYYIFDDWENWKRSLETAWSEYV